MLLLLWVACRDDIQPRPPSGEGEDTGTTPTEDPTGLDSGVTTVPAPLIDALSAQIHDRIGSIVVVTWDQGAAADVHLEYSFDPDVWLSSPTRSLEAGPQQDLLLGVPYGEEVTWRLVAEEPSGSTTTPDAVITTAALPPEVPEGRVLVSDPARYDAEAAPYWLVGLAVVDWPTDPWWVVIVDRAGRVVWAMRSPMDRTSMHSRVSRDGTSLLMDRNSYWASFDGGAGSTIDQMKIDGTVLHTFETPGLHHPFTDLPDGSVAYGASAGGYTGERVVIVHQDGTVESLFDCGAWLASIGVNATCASNTLTYDEPSNTLLFSMYSFETIIRIHRDTGLVDDWYGHIDGSWSFDPPSSAFWWQHGGHVTDAGTLLTSSDDGPAATETVVREYEIDAASRTLRQIWSFGLGEGLYGGVMGEAVRLPNGNTLHNYGGLARVREVTPDREVVWDMAWDAGAMGRSMPIADLYALAP